MRIDGSGWYELLKSFDGPKARGTTRFMLIGLVEPMSEDVQAGFDEWFVDQHVEDTAHCPNMVRGQVYKLRGPHGNITTVSQYLSVYGVPNKLDPFLRPLMVHVMNQLGLYDYGMEKSFTPRGLRSVLERAGFEVVGFSGILFIPGWLRMFDLVCHTRWPTLSSVSGALVRPFAWLYDRFPSVRRHGYLIACAVTKPHPDSCQAVP